MWQNPTPSVSDVPNVGEESGSPKHRLKHPSDTMNRVSTVPQAGDSGLRNKYLFNPQIVNSYHFKVFKNLVLRDLENIQSIKNINLHYISEGIISLGNRKDVIIRPADKGGGVVMLDKEFYHRPLLDLLNDKVTFKRLASDPNIR